ncbi:major facilitator superfamily MFS_1 [Petrotoga mobilis SJ95]|uniref:Major facilitator superfamily MFS_1 n=1 Tax=Petrotoga mobilis (strain DSM 10674 / SJ95) TaxID=403833 RepID=A9BIJ8_PETMO|nr:MFS transporter [Petrotoga mobilis]ABX32161.1 major facilitator superfamily MFS_1 [Petrotoga mobilis SJ95]
MTKYAKTRFLSILEAGSYNAFFIGTQGFIFTSIALYFNASPLFISIMTSFPIIAQMFQIFSSRINQFIGSKKKSLVINAFISRTLFVLLPIFIFFDVRSEYIMLIIILLFSFFGTFVGNTWTVLIRSVVPFEQRGKYFGLRNIFASITGIIMLYLYSIFLEFPNFKTGLLLVTSFMAIFSVLSAFLLVKHEFPEESEKNHTVNLNIFTPFKDRNFKNFLLFMFVWSFAIEFVRPYFAYYEVAILNINYQFLGNMGIITSVISVFLYLFYGIVADRFGSKNVLSLGILLSTFSPMMYFLMNESNYRSILLLNAIFAAFAWSAINLAIFNLLLEISKEPSENYIAANSFVAGIAAIFGSLSGGFLANHLENIEINFMGDPYHGIQLIFIIGFILRIVSVILLTEVEAMEKPIRYKGIFSPEAALFKRREINFPFDFFRRNGKKVKKNELPLSADLEKEEKSQVIQEVPEEEKSQVVPNKNKE